ncbi:MAG: hypothetical protein AAB393_09985, partial [Bacteroidota bacterium]
MNRFITHSHHLIRSLQLKGIPMSNLQMSIRLGHSGKSLPRYGEKQSLSLFLLLLLSLLCSPIEQAGAQRALVTVRLQQPPPNQLRAADLWKLTLNNTDTTTYRIRLVATLDEAAAGRVADGQSGVMSLPPGRKTITYDDVKRGGSVTFKAGRWRDAFTRTGNAPSGDYTICIYVKTETGEELVRDCIQQNVEIVSGPTLISPADGETIPEGQMPMFTWLPPTPAPPGVQYHLRIVEVLGNQSPSDAMQRNAAWFEKGDIRTTTFQYPTSAKKLEKGKKFAWKVGAFVGGQLRGESETWGFVVLSCGALEISDTVWCAGRGSNLYNYVLTFKNPSTDLNCVMTVTSITVSPSIIPVTIGPLPIVNPSQTVTISGTIGPTVLTSGSFTINATGPGFAGTWNNSFTLPVCACCDGFTHRVESLGITSTNPSSGLIQLTGSLVAGPKPIQKVSAELVYLYHNANDTNCVKCNSNSENFGNIKSGTLGGFAGGVVTALTGAPYGREIIWTSSTGVNMTTGKPLSIDLAMPLAKSLWCCSDTLRFCIRFSFTDTSCVTCDTLICVTAIRTASGIIMAMNELDAVRLYQENLTDSYPSTEAPGIDRVATVHDSCEIGPSNREEELGRLDRTSIPVLSSGVLLAYSGDGFDEPSLYHTDASSHGVELEMIQQPGLTITSPVEFSTHYCGTTIPIMWTPSGSPPTVTISINQYGVPSPVQVLYTTASNTGLYNWLIPNTVPAGNYSISVSAGSAGDNDSITINCRQTGGCGISLTSPGSSSQWNCGASIPVAWTS